MYSANAIGKPPLGQAIVLALAIAHLLTLEARQSVSVIKLAPIVMIFLGSVTLDQVSKRHAEQELLQWQDENNVRQYRGRSIFLDSIGTPRDPGPTSFYIGTAFTYSRNTGAAFSILADLDDKVRVPFFYAVTMIAVVAIFFFFNATPQTHYLTRYGLIMILGGAIGNFLDRMRLGYVVDFLDVHWSILGWRHDFAIFNFADVSINIGVICYLIDALRLWQNKHNSAATAKPQN